MHNRVANGDVWNAFDGAQITGKNFLRLAATKTLELIHFGNTSTIHASIGAAQTNSHARLDASAHHTTNGNASDIFAVVQIGHQELQWTGGVHLWRGHMRENGVEQIIHATILLVLVAAGPAIASTGPKHREIKGNFIGAQFNEKVEHFIHNGVSARVWAIALVHHNDWLQAKLNCFLQHKARLRHRAFKRVD